MLRTLIVLPSEIDRHGHRVLDICQIILLCLSNDFIFQIFVVHCIRVRVFLEAALDFVLEYVLLGLDREGLTKSTWLLRHATLRMILAENEAELFGIRLLVWSKSCMERRSS